MRSRQCAYREAGNETERSEALLAGKKKKYLKQCMGSSSIKALSKSVEVLVVSKQEEAGTSISATQYPIGQLVYQRELGKERANKSLVGVRTNPRH